MRSLAAARGRASLDLRPYLHDILQVVGWVCEENVRRLRAAARDRASLDLGLDLHGKLQFLVNGGNDVTNANQLQPRVIGPALILVLIFMGRSSCCG